MKAHNYLLAFSIGCLLSLTTRADEASQQNVALIEKAFDDWRAGQGGIFDLLAESAVWVVAGSSPYSGTYHSRERFMEDAVKPITARLATPIVPTVRQIVAQGPLVVVHWDGVATAKNGSLYENSYSWHMQLEDGRITKVTAFLDTWRLVELMN